MTISTYGGTLSHEEVEAIKAKAAEIKGCDHVSVTIDGDCLDIDYHVMPFIRIHRITGYLVGDDSRWNDGKKAELKDRLAHNSVEELI